MKVFIMVLTICMILMLTACRIPRGSSREYDISKLGGDF